MRQDRINAVFAHFRIFHSIVPFLSLPYIVAILIALTVHEVAHGIVALKLGDTTARDAGRLTLNPLAHLDLFGALMFLTVGFGWAKPVPVDPRFFRHPKRDMTLVALAGPASNLLLALCTFFVAIAINSLSFPLGFGGERLLAEFVQNMFLLNLGLMAFNLLPIAPLDGSKILAMFIPWQYEEAYERFLAQGPMLLLILLIAERAFGFPLIVWWITTITSPIFHVLDGLT